MPYVALPYPSVLYSATGVPQLVATAAMAAALPIDYTAVPVVAVPVFVPALDPLVVISTADALAPSVIVPLAAITVLGAVPLVVEAGGPIAPPLNG
jgi:hypothetical protein